MALVLCFAQAIRRSHARGSLYVHYMFNNSQICLRLLLLDSHNYHHYRSAVTTLRNVWGVLTASLAGCLAIDYYNYSHIIYLVSVSYGIFPAVLSGPKSEIIQNGLLKCSRKLSKHNRASKNITLKWKVPSLFVVYDFGFLIHIWWGVRLSVLSVFCGLWSGVSQERSRQSNWILLLRSINDQGASLGRVTIIPLTLRNCGYISLHDRTSHIAHSKASIHRSVLISMCSSSTGPLWIQ